MNWGSGGGGARYSPGMYKAESLTIASRLFTRYFRHSRSTVAVRRTRARNLFLLVILTQSETNQICGASQRAAGRVCQSRRNQRNCSTCHDQTHCARLNQTQPSDRSSLIRYKQLVFIMS